MAWCHQATSHYLSQCWLRSVSRYGISMPKWVVRWQCYHLVYLWHYFVTEKLVFISKFTLTSSIDLFQEKRRDREALVKQVAESQDTCQSLRSLVGKLRSSLNQCMPKDAEGNPEQVEFTPEKIRAIRVSVQETEDLAQYLSVGLEGRHGQ